MNIWEILGIEPTNDIKAIKKAYALKTKEIHPEEKPEEFRILYEAYQVALKHVKSGKKEETIPLYILEKGKEIHKATNQSWQSEKEPSKEPEEENKLLSYFAKNRELQEERLATAAECWKDAWKKYRWPEEREELKGYLNSREFRDVQWHPQVVHLLVEEFQKPMYHNYDELWLCLWELYGFEEKEDTIYQGDIQKLQRILYPAYQRQNQEKERAQREEEERLAYEKRRKLYRLIGLVAAIVLGLLQIRSR